MSSPELAILLAVIACCIGGALGGFSLVRPEDVLAAVGFKSDPDRPRSLGAIRATYGGLMLASHGGVAAALGYAPGVGATMALGLALAWLGAAAGRAYSMVREETGVRKEAGVREEADGRFSLWATVFALLMGLTLALPFWSFIADVRGAGPAVLV